jgi:hypothetical protein
MIIAVLFSFLSLFSLHVHGSEDDDVINFDRLLTQIVIERFEKQFGKGIIKDQVSLSIFKTIETSSSWSEFWGSFRTGGFLRGGFFKGNHSGEILQEESLSGNPFSGNPSVGILQWGSFREDPSGLDG